MKRAPPFQWYYLRSDRSRAPAVLSLAFLVLLLLANAWGGAASAPGNVVVLTVHGVIDPVVARYVQRGLTTATVEQAELVVIQLDTPGGLDTAMRDIVQAILNSQVPVVVYVSPAGARAASAGVFITMAAHIAVMAPSTNIGAAHPVFSGEEIPEVLDKKATNDAVAYIQAIAEERGRNATWAEEAVRKSESLSAQGALEANVIDLVANSLDELLRQIDEREVIVGGETKELQVRHATVRDLPMTPLEAILHAIVDPNIAYLLLTLGMAALVAEFYHPGAILPGVSGIICLILAFVALGSLPVNWGGIALIVLAFALFLLDIKIAGFALSVGGAISFLLGSLLLFSPFKPEVPAMPRVSVSPWLAAAMTALLAGFFVFALTAGVRAQRRAVWSGIQTLIGATGVAVSDLTPNGVVQVQSESWSAVADQPPIQAGEAIQVVAVEGLRLRVKRFDSHEPSELSVDSST